MGYMRHHAIIVTSWSSELLNMAYDRAKIIFPKVSFIIGSEVNGYKSFFVPPDGSKEGWNSSDKSDSRREEYIDWLDAQRYDDNSTSLDWVEVQYGDNERETRIIRHSDEHELKLA